MSRPFVAIIIMTRSSRKPRNSKLDVRKNVKTGLDMMSLMRLSGVVSMYAISPSAATANVGPIRSHASTNWSMYLGVGLEVARWQ